VVHGFFGPFVFFGLFGGKEIIGVLRTWKLYGRDPILFVVFLVFVDCGLPVPFVS
jgi:hypothetical protein